MVVAGADVAAGVQVGVGATVGVDDGSGVEVRSGVTVGTSVAAGLAVSSAGSAVGVGVDGAQPAIITPNKVTSVNALCEMRFIVHLLRPISLAVSAVSPG